MTGLPRKNERILGMVRKMVANMVWKGFQQGSGTQAL
jgi:hypothetical protein